MEVAALQEELAGFKKETVEKEAEIRNLARACDERLRLIERLQDEVHRLQPLGN